MVRSRSTTRGACPSSYSPFCGGGLEVQKAQPCAGFPARPRPWPVGRGPFRTAPLVDGALPLPAHGCGPARVEVDGRKQFVQFCCPPDVNSSESRECQKTRTAILLFSRHPRYSSLTPGWLAGGPILVPRTVPSARYRARRGHTPNWGPLLLVERPLLGGCYSA